MPLSSVEEEVALGQDLLPWLGTIRLYVISSCVVVVVFLVLVFSPRGDVRPHPCALPTTCEHVCKYVCMYKCRYVHILFRFVPSFFFWTEGSLIHVQSNHLMCATQPTSHPFLSPVQNKRTTYSSNKIKIIPLSPPGLKRKPCLYLPASRQAPNSGDQGRGGSSTTRRDLSKANMPRRGRRRSRDSNIRRYLSSGTYAKSVFINIIFVYCYRDSTALHLRHACIQDPCLATICVESANSRSQTIIVKHYYLYYINNSHAWQW